MFASDFSARVDPIVASLIGETFGSIRIQNAWARYGEDSDERYAVTFHLELSDPEGPTWPWPDVQSLLRSLSSRVPPDLGLPWYHHLHPETDDPPEDDDEDALALFG